MDNKELIQEFETKVQEITNECIKDFKESKSSITEVFNKFQKEVTNKSSATVDKAYINNLENRENLIEKLSKITIGYAATLKYEIE